MGSLFVSEFKGAGPGRLSVNGLLPTFPAANSVVALTAAAATANLGSGTNFLMVSADVGCWIGFASSTVAGSTVGAVTSTNGFRIPANVAPIPINASPNARLTAIST